MSIKLSTHRLVKDNLVHVFYEIKSRVDCPPVGDFNKDVADIMMVLNGFSHPEDIFDFIGSGMYKETYRLNHSRNYVVKFVSYTNDTAREIALMNAMAGKGISRFFIPSFFVNTLNMRSACLLRHLGGYTAEDLDDDEPIHDPSEYEECQYVIIQPAIDGTAIDADAYMWDIYMAYHCDEDENPDSVPEDFGGLLYDPLTGEVIPYEEADAGIWSRRWVDSFLDTWGRKSYKNLHDFISEFEITDLHNGNLGWFCGKPVIIDWYSDSEKL